MVEKVVSATSGRLSGWPDVNTEIQKIESSTWTSRSISINVSETRRGKRLVNLNDRLCGCSSKNTVSTE